jgi:hypothetical protein
LVCSDFAIVAFYGIGGILVRFGRSCHHRWSGIGKILDSNLWFSIGFNLFAIIAFYGISRNIGLFQ